MISLHAAVLSLVLAGPTQDTGEVIRVACTLDPELASRIEYEDGALSAEHRRKRQLGSILETVKDVREALGDTTIAGALEFVADRTAADVVVTIIGRAYYYDSTGEVETVWASVAAGRLFTVPMGFNPRPHQRGWQQAASALAYRVAEWVKSHRPEILANRTTRG
jgi:hypothetical protein